MNRQIRSHKTSCSSSVTGGRSSLLLSSAILLGICNAGGFADAVDAQSATAMLCVERIEEIFLHGCPGSSRPEDLWTCATEARNELSQQGDAAVEAVKAALSHSTSPALCSFLLFSIREVDSSLVDELLLDLFFEESELSIKAAGELTSRAREGRLISAAVSEERMEILRQRVAELPILKSGRAATLLAVCGGNSVTQRAEPILARYLHEVENPSEGISAHHSYMSPRLLALNPFLLAFSYMGDSCQPILRERLAPFGTEQEELRKWLAIALGMAGDPNQSEALRALAEQDSDVYVRFAATEAYASSAGAVGIPVLEALLKDKTPSPCYTNVDGTPFYPVHMAAKQALNRLKHESERDANE